MALLSRRAVLSLTLLAAAGPSRAAFDTPGAVSLAPVVAAQWPPLDSAVYRATEIGSPCLCHALCQMDARCQAAGAALLDSGRFWCRLADRRMVDAPPQAPPSADEGGWFERTGARTLEQTCWWVSGECGPPPDCAALRQVGVITDGVYTIQASERPVYCDMESSSGGWTLLQRRGLQPTTLFGRLHDEYLTGFGDPSGEFWQGLTTLERLYDMGNQKLRVDMWRGGEHIEAVYLTSDLLPRSSYRAKFDQVAGTASDELGPVSSKPFVACTKLPCAYGGFWGYSATGGGANLNGAMNPVTDEWELIWGLDVVNRTEIKMRPQNFDSDV